MDGYRIYFKNAQVQKSKISLILKYLMDGNRIIAFKAKSRSFSNLKNKRQIHPNPPVY